MIYLVDVNELVIKFEVCEVVDFFFVLNCFLLGWMLLDKSNENEDVTAGSRYKKEEKTVD